MSARALTGSRRWLALAGCLVWFAFTLFPLYWAAVTSFKSPIGVVQLMFRLPPELLILPKPLSFAPLPTRGSA